MRHFLISLLATGGAILLYWTFFSWLLGKLANLNLGDRLETDTDNENNQNEKGKK